MIQYAFIQGNWTGKEDPDLKNCWVGGELQQRLKIFGTKHKIVKVSPFADKIVMVEYED